MYITFLDKNGGGGGTSGVVVTTKTVNVSSNPQTITANTGYAWSAVTINSNNVYSSGYTDGYTSGSTDGESIGYTSGYTDGYTSGYTDASALIPVITGESYTYSEDDDFVKTISAQTGTAFSAVTVDATNKYVSGYKTAADDANTHSEELTVSANGIYNANIQYDIRGYYKKVTVDVPSYGVVADLTGKYFIIGKRASSPFPYFAIVSRTHTGANASKQNDYASYKTTENRASDAERPRRHLYPLRQEDRQQPAYLRERSTYLAGPEHRAHLPEHLPLATGGRDPEQGRGGHPDYSGRVGQSGAQPAAHHPRTELPHRLHAGPTGRY